MNLVHRRINLKTDKEYILERHCRINYECECAWKKKLQYETYREEWFKMKNQQKEFLEALTLSMKDNRTIASVIKNDQGIIVAYLWVPFFFDDESKFTYAEIQDLYVETEFQNKKIATLLIDYAEKKAKENGAQVIRSATGCENLKSMSLHKKLGYSPYRIEFEKIL